MLVSRTASRRKNEAPIVCSSKPTVKGVEVVGVVVRIRPPPISRQKIAPPSLNGPVVLPEGLEDWRTGGLEG